MLKDLIYQELVAKKWYKLKVYDEHNIAVGCFVSHYSAKDKIRVVVISFNPDWGTIQEISETIRSFKKKDKKIAYWYFYQLCKLWRRGIYINEGKINKNPMGRWDHEDRRGL